MNREKLDEGLAWLQIALSVPALFIFMFLNTKNQIQLIGLVTMVTWTGTAIAHLSAARGKKKVMELNVSVDSDDERE